VQDILTRDHPRYVLINLKEPDFSGHAKDWDGYLAGLKASDSIAWALWQFLESDSFYAGRTAYFVTSDHGRHLDGIKDGFVSHGDDCEGCRRMILFAAGPDFLKGVIVETAREQIDLAVTAARLLGLRLPGSLGKILPELFPPVSAAASSDTAAAGTDTAAAASDTPSQ
jgi:phosphopentomutase